VKDQDNIFPAAVDAERTILGSVLLDNQAWSDVSSRLRPADFSLDSNQRIGRAMKRLSDAGSSIDIVTLANDLNNRHEIEAVGGVAYLASLTQDLPRRPVIDEYIKIVKDKSVLRSLMSVCSQTIARAGDQGESGIELAGHLQSEIEKIADSTQDTKKAPVDSFIVEVMDEAEREYIQRVAPCIPTGNAWLDSKMGGGFRTGKYTIVAARPKVGKSAFAGSAIAYNCTRGTKVVDFSLEMDRGEIVKNLVPYVEDIPNIVVSRAWTQTPDQHAQVTRGLGAIAEWPLSVYDGEMDIDKVCWAMDRETRHGEAVLFVLDHFGLMGGTGGSEKIRERYVDNSARLRKKIASKKNCAMLTLFQLNPVPRQYADNRPLPEDLKESKNPLEDAYACILLHRYVSEGDFRMTTKANINLALIRGGGSPGNVDCDFDRKKLEFVAPAELELDDDVFFE